MNDEDRAASVRTRKAQADLRASQYQIEKEKAEMMWKVELADLQRRLDDIQAEGEEDDSISSGEAIMAFLASLQNSGAPVQSDIESSGSYVGNTTSSATTSQASRSLSDEEIMSVIDRFPRKHVKMAALMPEGILAQKISHEMPGYDADTYRRAVLLVKDRK